MGKSNLGTCSLIAALAFVAAAAFAPVATASPVTVEPATVLTADDADACAGPCYNECKATVNLQYYHAYCAVMAHGTDNPAVEEGGDLCWKHCYPDTVIECFASTFPDEPAPYCKSDYTDDIAFAASADECAGGPCVVECTAELDVHHADARCFIISTGVEHHHPLCWKHCAQTLILKCEVTNDPWKPYTYRCESDLFYK